MEGAVGARHILGSHQRFACVCVSDGQLAAGIQRGSGIAVLAGTKTHLSSTRAPAADSAHSSKPASPPAKKGRLSFKQKHALETLPARMDELQKMKAQLQARLEDPEFYSKDADGFAKVMAAMAKVEAELSATEEEWLALEVLREELEG
jgi:ATP-binding cassette subfamily F protein uup